MSKLEELFNAAHTEELEKTKITSKPSLKNDPRLIHFKPGNTFRFRLLLTPGDERKSPFINKNTHVFYDKEGSNRLNYVVCSTSEYMAGRNGYNQCQTCGQLNKWWDEGQKGSQTSKELYSTFRRQFNGFVLVYVINDPLNEENNGTVKIMRYGANIRKYLKAKIHGINDKDDSVIEGADSIGIEAFKLKGGRDLIITVGEKPVIENGKKKVYPEYTCEFASKTSDISLTEKQSEKCAKELRFDEDFYEVSTKEERDAFYKEFVLREDVSSEVDTTTKTSTITDTQEPMPDNVQDVKPEDVKPEEVNDIIKEDIKLDESDLDGIDDIEDLLKDLDDI